MGLGFSVVGLFISSYLYYEFLKEGLLGRLWIFGSFLGILWFCFSHNSAIQVNWLNGTTLFICAFSLEENTAFLIRKTKAYIKSKKEKKKRLILEKDIEEL